MRNKVVCLVAALLAVFLSIEAYAENYHQVLVVHITDGDTLTVTDAGQRYMLDVAGIDAPELDQPHGWQSKRALAGMVFDRRVWVSGFPGQRQTPAKIFVERSAVAELLVRDGHAWVSPGGTDNGGLKMTEKQARLAAKGLWATPQAVAPWQWRARGSNP